MNEYKRLKQEAGDQLRELKQLCTAANMERMLCQENLDTELCKKTKIDHQYKMITKGVDETKNKVEKVKEFVM